MILAGLVFALGHACTTNKSATDASRPSTGGTGGSANQATGGVRDAAADSVAGTGGGAVATGKGGAAGGGGTITAVGGVTTATGGTTTSAGGATGATGGATAFAGGARSSTGGATPGAGGATALAGGVTAALGGSATGGATTGSGGSASGGAKGAGGATMGGTAAWNNLNNGNPFIPGYFADPSIFYDADTKTFYLFATTDGNWIAYSAEPTVWYSTDFVHWKSQPLTLPSTWPKQELWAPSVMKHPSNGQYYLIYACGGIGTCIARSTSPLGPWINATAGTTTATAPLYNNGQMWGGNDWFDAQFFVDGSTVYMTFGGGGACGIATLAFGSDLSAAIDNTDTRMTNGTVHKFKQLTGLTNYLEGSVMFKSGTQYFLAYSNSACQNYNVQYAVATSPVGPFTHAAGMVVQRDNTKNILGPGHNSILQYGGDSYIVYHRQHYPYVDVKRQTAIDRIVVNGSTISAGVQTQEGVFAGTGALETLVSRGLASSETDLAFARPVVALSESDYQGGVSGNITETFPAIKGFYAARYAVDYNNGTRWAPTTLPGSLIVDLGADLSVGRCETTFEYVLRVYKYRIEYLAQAEAASLSAAQSSTAWHMYADRSGNTANLSPVADVGPFTARYLKVTVLSANLPTASGEIRTILQTDYADRVSIVEFKAFESTSAL